MWSEHLVGFFQHLNLFVFPQNFGLLIWWCRPSFCSRMCCYDSRTYTLIFISTFASLSRFSPQHPNKYRGLHTSIFTNVETPRTRATLISETLRIYPFYFTLVNSHWTINHEWGLRPIRVLKCHLLKNKYFLRI